METGLTLDIEGETCRVETARYGGRADGPLAVLLVGATGPYARLSTYVPESEGLPRDGFYLKDWAENETATAAALAGGLLVPLRGVPPARAGHAGLARAYRLATQSEAALRARGPDAGSPADTEAGG